MSYIVNAESFLAAIFANRERRSISFKSLKSIKNTIEIELNGSICIDITKESMYSAESNNFIFFGRKRILLKKTNKDKIKAEGYVNAVYNFDMPKEIESIYMREVMKIAK